MPTAHGHYPLVRKERSSEYHPLGSRLPDLTSLNRFTTVSLASDPRSLLGTIESLTSNTQTRKGRECVDFNKPSVTLIILQVLSPHAALIGSGLEMAKLH